VAVSPGACDRCLRRAWLLEVLAPYIDRTATGDPGSRTRELLGLSNEDLARAVAPTDAAVALDAVRALGGSELRARAAAAGLWATCRHDECYPDVLRWLGDAPASLLGAGSSEALTELESGSAVTVVGSRRGSPYGERVARSLARDLSRAGVTVVSGLALGVDGAAHEGALEGPQATIAVLGCGPNVAYPSSNTSIYREIRARGAVISELPPGMRPWRWTFPARNRIMAALTGMTVVVAAARQSGSLITTDIAADLGREVGAVPGPITAPSSSGTNSLLAEGARVIRGAQDVLDALYGPGARSITAQGPPLEPDLAAVLEAIERELTDCDSIAVALGRDGGTIAAALARLEVLGYVEGSFSGRYSRTALEQPAVS
jgi:DNA processing protein